MEKENMFVNEEKNTMPPTWSSSNFVTEIQTNELNCTSQQLPNCHFNPNWDNSVDQVDPFESALSSMVSSPSSFNAGLPSSGGDGIVLRELIGRLGSICSSGEISPPPYFSGNNSTNTSFYSTPLNSPPKLNLSMVDHQIVGNLPIPGNHFLGHPSLAPFPADPRFVERAARLSCFGSRSFGGRIGLSEPELFDKLTQRIDSGKLSRISSNQSIKVHGHPIGFQENKDGLLEDKISGSGNKFSRLSRSSTPENGELGVSLEESTVSEHIPGGDIGLKANNNSNSKKRKSIPRGKAKAAAENEESNSKRSKADETDGNEKDAAKSKGESNGNKKGAGDRNEKQVDDNQKPPEPPKDYIHVRARRGQATDSHSLAERVRREKISERMKFLQDLVPGCDKVTGKAVMLDEIINYVQSLQRQVEFLSMKLATVNPRMDFNMEALLSKDIFQSRRSLPHSMYPLDNSAQALPYPFQSQQRPTLHSGIPCASETSFSMNPVNSAMHRNPGMQLPPINGFGEPASQASTFWEDDLQSLVQMGFSQNQLQNLQGTMATSHMKVEP